MSKDIVIFLRKMKLTIPFHVPPPLKVSCCYLLPLWLSSVGKQFFGCSTATNHLKLSLQPWA